MKQTPRDDVQQAPSIGQAGLDWAIAQAPRRSRLVVEEAALEVLQWGAEDAPGLLLMHGNRAQADWWSFIAPYFTESRHVAAFSFSGMGRSDWRESYSIEGMAREAMAVAEETGLFAGSQAPVFVAHSLAGLPLAHIVADHGARLAGAVLIDTLLRAPPARTGHRPPGADRRHKTYPTREAALARFRLLPAQAAPNEAIVAFIAGHAVVETEGGNGASDWTWRYDPTIVGTLKTGDEENLIARALCPVALVSGEASPLVTPSVIAGMLEQLPAATVSVVVPEAGHHVFIDQPIATIATLRTLLAIWSNLSTR
jgi:pimeloyl-ACP methyl ester carboxylesterase